MILVKWPAWRTILFYVFIYIFNSLHVSSTSSSSSGETNCAIQPLVAVTLCRWPCRVQVFRPTKYKIGLQWFPLDTRMKPQYAHRSTRHTDCSVMWYNSTVHVEFQHRIVTSSRPLPRNSYWRNIRSLHIIITSFATKHTDVQLVHCH
jgi:hypothetical protein